MKESKVSRLKDSSTSISDEEWKSILRALFLAKPHEEDRRWFPSIELSANVKDTSIELAVLEDVKGIKRRLGNISIPNGDAEVQLFQYICIGLRERDEANERIRGMESSVHSQEEKIKRLTEQLKDLVEAKERYEEEMIKKFQLILNEKKRKIRQLHKGEAVAAEESSEDEEVSMASKGKTKGKGKGKLKRKASDPEPEVDMDETDDDASDVSMTGKNTPDVDSGDEGDETMAQDEEEESKEAKSGTPMYEDDDDL